MYPCEDDIKGNPVGNARDKAVLDSSNDVRLILDIDLFLAPKATFAKMSYGPDLVVNPIENWQLRIEPAVWVQVGPDPSFLVPGQPSPRAVHLGLKLRGWSNPNTNQGLYSYCIMGIF